MMSLQRFKEVVHDLLPYLLKVNLYDEGEPLLNPDLPDIAEHLSTHRVASCVSTNFSLKMPDDRLRRLVGCGLDHLIVAVDGITHDTYSRYRVGGDLDLVLRNLRRASDLVRSIARCGLHIELQFIEFEHNAHEAQRALALAESMHLWRATVIRGSSAHGWKGLRFAGTQAERRSRGCYQIWVSATIDSTGRLGACDYGEDHGMPCLGMADGYRRDRLRNGPLIRALRLSFGRKGLPLHEVCCHCSLYRRGRQGPTASD